MKKDTFFFRRVFPIVFMLLITAVCIAIVSSIFLSTEDLVKLNESLFLKRAVLYAANIDVPQNPEEAQKVFSKRVKEIKNSSGQIDHFEIMDENGNLSGYVLFSSGPGLWGQIQAVVGFKKDLKTLTGVEFTKQNETPGLGARITEAWFKEQFRGKHAPFTLVPEGAPAGPNQFDAITGASRTSNYVKQIMNKAADQAASLTTS